MKQVELMLHNKIGITGLSTQESALLMAKALERAAGSIKPGMNPRVHEVESAFYDELRERASADRKGRRIDPDCEKIQDEVGDLVGRVSLSLSW
jgi:hypothetical protein